MTVDLISITTGLPGHMFDLRGNSSTSDTQRVLFSARARIMRVVRTFVEIEGLIPPLQNVDPLLMLEGSSSNDGGSNA